MTFTAELSKHPSKYCQIDGRRLHKSPFFSLFRGFGGSNEMSAAARTQDLPPKQGYAPISFKRIPPKSYFKGITLIAGYFAMTFGGFYLYALNYWDVEREEVEMRSARNAIIPLLRAERDREFLKQLRRNRDEESKLMANVKGWEVGTWYGEPIYKTVSEDTLISPSFKEYYGHTTYAAAAKRAHIKLYN